MWAIFFLLFINNGMVLTAQIGRVYKARLVTSTNSTWLYEQPNVNTCICTAMHLFDSSLFASNYFSSNRSCQIFISSIDSPEIVSYPSATLILYRPLPNPCCSNLTWLLTRIQRAQKPSSVAVTNPTFLSINSANQLLSVMSYNDQRILFNCTNLSSIVNTTVFRLSCAIASQFGNLFIASCDNPNTVLIYNETNFGLQLLHTLPTINNSRQVVFLSNNTWLLVALQYVSRIEIYSVDLITNTFQYNQSVVLPRKIVWTLTKRSETLIYICFWEYGAPVYTLSYNGSSWIVSYLSATQTSIREIPGQVAIDSCGRLWVAVYGFGIRIYDATGQILLANWSTVSTGLAALLILPNYEVFLGDYDNNRIDHYAPDLQCTN